MSDTVRIAIPEPRGWSLPFAERYRAIHRDIEVLPSEITHCRHLAEVYGRKAAQAEERLAAAQAAWARMQTGDAAEVAAYQRHCEAIRARLRDAGWKV